MSLEKKIIYIRILKKSQFDKQQGSNPILSGLIIEIIQINVFTTILEKILIIEKILALNIFIRTIYIIIPIFLIIMLTIVLILDLDITKQIFND